MPCFLYAVIVQNNSWAEDMAANWNDVAPIPFMYDKNDTVSGKLREFYLGSLDGPITNDSLPGLGRVRLFCKIKFEKFKK